MFINYSNEVSCYTLLFQGALPPMFLPLTELPLPSAYPWLLLLPPNETNLSFD